LAEQFNATTDSPNKQLERTFDSWADQGYWATLPLLLILLLAFRRGLLACLLIAPLLAMPEPSYAFGWDDLWATKDQQGAKALEQGDLETAQQQFQDPNWKAAAAYRNGDFETAKELYSAGENTDYYNLGNSLAKSGKLEEAMESYNKALELDPNNDDAKFNKERVEEKIRQQQEQQKPQQNSPNNKPQDPSQGDPQQGDPQDPSQKENDENEQQQDKLQDNPPDQSSSSQQDPDQKEQEKENEQQAQEGQEQQQMTSTSEQKQTDEAQNSEQGQASQGYTEPKEMTDEEKQAMEQWLRKIPDDPGGLLREKFRYESKKRNYERRRGITPPSETNEERW
jgi:Ca-activated chloride channel family protein